MPGTTPLGLPYPVGTDRPCDTAAVLASLAEATEREMTEVASAMNAAKWPQAAIVEYSSSTPIEVTAGNTVVIPYNTVVVDTGGLVSLSTNPTTITLPAGFTWTCGVYVQMDMPTGVGSFWNVQFNALEFPSSLTWQRIPNAATVAAPVRDYIYASADAIYATSFEEKIEASVQTLVAVGDTRIRYAQMWAYWVAG